MSGCLYNRINATCLPKKFFVASISIFFAIIHPGVQPRCGVNAEALGLISDKEVIVKVENNRPYTLLTG